MLIGVVELVVLGTLLVKVFTLPLAKLLNIPDKGPDKNSLPFPFGVEALGTKTKDCCFLIKTVNSHFVCLLQN